MKTLLNLACLHSASALCLFFCPTGWTQEIIRIEEDWELHVSQPDEQLDAPQITTMMFPVGK